MGASSEASGAAGKAMGGVAIAMGVGGTTIEAGAKGTGMGLEARSWSGFLVRVSIFMRRAESGLTGSGACATGTESGGLLLRAGPDLARKVGMGSCCAAGVFWNRGPAKAPVDGALLLLGAAGSVGTRKVGMGSCCAAGVF